MLGWLSVNFIRIALRPGLRSLPGPLSARFFRFYRSSLVFGGKAPEEYRKLHEQYGQVVRVGPNHVSISDPAAIPIIYGIGTGAKYLKVCLSLGVPSPARDSWVLTQNADQFLQHYESILSRQGHAKCIYGTRSEGSSEFETTCRTTVQHDEYAQLRAICGPVYRHLHRRHERFGRSIDRLKCVGTMVCIRRNRLHDIPTPIWVPGTSSGHRQYDWQSRWCATLCEIYWSIPRTPSISVRQSDTCADSEMALPAIARPIQFIREGMSILDYEGVAWY